MKAGLFMSGEWREDGPPLVLLHGLAGTHRVWDRVRAALGGTVSTLAYDLPGHGGSLIHAQDMKASPAARAVLADLRDRGIDRFHLAGHSFGGAVAALMALAEPDRVASLTLFAPGGIGPEINAPLLRSYASAETREEIASCLAAMSARAPSEKMIEDALQMRASTGQMEALARLCAAITRNGNQGVIAREELAGLAMPVHVAWGGKDPVLPPRQADNLPHRFVRHLFPGLGHMLPEEAPEEMAQLLLSRHS